MSCPTTVHETVCVEALVKIEPEVTVGEIRTFCVGEPVIGICAETPVEFCSFPVSQQICVQVPLTFHAIATAEPVGIACGTPETGACPDTISGAGETEAEPRAPQPSTGCNNCGASVKAQSRW